MHSSYSRHPRTAKILGAVEMMGEQAHPGTAVPFLAGFPPHVTGLSVERACTTAMRPERALELWRAVVLSAAAQRYGRAEARPSTDYAM